MMTDYLLTIDGEQVATADALDVVNPATGETFAYAPECTPEVLETAMASAELAQRSWRIAETSVRRHALRACAAVLMEAADEFASVLTSEQGKPLREAKSEVKAAAGWFAYFADMEIPLEVVHEDENLRVEVHRRALGVVAAITPWNYPLLLASWKVAPALLAGNAVVLKPSPYTPLTALLLGTKLASVLPRGVLNVVTGSDALGPLVTEHPIPRKISFTGSTATGRHVAMSAAKTLKHVTMELGGNDAAIVLDDVAPESIVDKLFWSSFANNGQTCVAIKRLYVPEARYDEYVDLLAQRAENAVVGDGADKPTQLGPVNNAMQRDLVDRMVENARVGGADVVAGGTAIDGPGYFYRPTIVANAKDDAELVAAEQFGPALPVLSYTSVEEALSRANDTVFGLGGSVWGSDVELAGQVASRLESGSAWVNTHMSLSPKYPFGGTKTSGIGIENGLLGYQSFTEIQTRHIAKN
jgi:acyl-CoA reductase-like NAD-dependent aldehyde dehydrogenase